MNALKWCGVAGMCGLLSAHAGTREYDVAAYVWPAYHPEPRWAELGIFADGKGEWQNVYESSKRTPDDRQDARPLWGFENEADPVVVARRIDAAVAAGVNVFIYDWYWYEGRPFLEGALDDGFLKAPNRDRMRFYLMWANHDVNGLWDNRRGIGKKSGTIWSAKVSEADFRMIVGRWIAKYFSQPNYYRIGGCPVLSIYNGQSFAAWEGLDVARKRIAYLRSEVKKAGFPGLHLQIVANSAQPVDFGVDSMTTYNWNYRIKKRVNSQTEPELSYRQYGELALGMFATAGSEAKAVGAVYFPNLSCGWDTNARYPKGERLPIAHGANPRDFEAFARRVRDWAEANVPEDLPRLITVNSWNEWTEGSYLEPDTRFGYGFLNALADVFGPCGRKSR